MTTKLSLLILAAALLAAPGFAQDHAKFDGKWALSLGRSDFGDSDAPTSRIDVIHIDGDKFTDEVHSTSDGGDDSYTISLAVDGRPVPVPADSPLADAGIMTVANVSAAWQGDSLVVTEEMTSAYIPGTTKGTITYALSPDGKLMSITSTSDAPFGATNTRMVFDKIQP
ncbi:MAG TPA: hypothetical protein VMB47_11480 [Candidatus Aquilonibacter sp.]|nr:hypothetical protein [Candidatus Aquilonibacter sp.]